MAVLYDETKFENGSNFAEIRAELNRYNKETEIAINGLLVALVALQSQVTTLQTALNTGNP